MGLWGKKKNIASENTDDTIFLNDNLNSKLEPQKFWPKKYDEIQPIANAIILQQPIIVCLTETVVSDRRRIIDYLCGVCQVVGFVVNVKEPHTYEFKLEN